MRGVFSRLFLVDSCNNETVPIQHSPCELFTKYLVCHPKHLDNQNIRKIILGNNLDYMGAPYLERLRMYCRPPRPFLPYSVRHAKSQRFLVAEDLKLFFLPTDKMKEAGSILKNSKAKEIVESSAIVKLAPEWICAMLHRHAIHVSPQAVEMYCRYYFNTAQLDAAEIRALIEQRTMVDEIDDPDQLSLERNLSLARRNDPRKMASRVGVSPIAGILHQMRYGVIPSSLELSSLLKYAQISALAQVAENVVGGAAERSRDFTLVSKMLTEMGELVATPEEDLLMGLQKLIIKTDLEPIPVIHQLTAGNHTTDIQPVRVIDERPKRAAGVPGGSSGRSPSEGEDA